MTNEVQRPSARIYTFPTRGRTTAVRGGEMSRPSASFDTRHLAVTACGSAWYHEEAIEDAAKKPKS